MAIVKQNNKKKLIDFLKLTNSVKIGIHELGMIKS